MDHHAESDRNMQLAVWQQFVTWRRNIQLCDQRTAQHLKESDFELFSTHLCFNLSLFSSHFFCLFLSCSYSSLLLPLFINLLSLPTCPVSIQLNFFSTFFTSLLRDSPNMGTQLQRLEPQCCWKNKSNNGHRNILLNRNTLLNIWVLRLDHTWIFWVSGGN